MPERAPTADEMEAICEKLMENRAVSGMFPEITHRGETVFFLAPNGRGWLARNVAVGNGILSLKWTTPDDHEVILSFIRENLLPTRASS